MFDEDGVLLFLLAACGTTHSREFVEIGSGDGVHGSNCANLAFNFGFHGLFVDASGERIRRRRRLYGEHPDTRAYPPAFVEEFVQAETIDSTIADAGFRGEIDVLSIDIDGNDYWVWKAIEVVRRLAPPREATRRRESPHGERASERLRG